MDIHRGIDTIDARHFTFFPPYLCVYKFVSLYFPLLIVWKHHVRKMISNGKKRERKMYAKQKKRKTRIFIVVRERKTSNKKETARSKYTQH